MMQKPNVVDVSRSIGILPNMHSKHVGGAGESFDSKDKRRRNDEVYFPA